HKKNKYIGRGLPELTPVEIVGHEVCEAGSPLALDNGQFTLINQLWGYMLHEDRLKNDRQKTVEN
ncbi:hypothetical protein, partial [Brotaphodocola sp.]|uniref:hypothetical protein n=1 Tax=Brotaphodocola sp. TaxID=3073577 RepID=UPI003D7EA6E9